MIIRYLLAFIIISNIAFAKIYTTDITPSFSGDRFNHIKILDQKDLAISKIDGYKFSEISDLAYLKSKHILYMISDEGILYLFDAIFDDKISKLKPLKAVELRKKNGKKFKSWLRDSEGMTLDNKNRLIISFEARPKVAWFHKNSQQIGRLIKKYKLPHKLKNPKNYRSKNKELEALAWHNRYGLLCAAEWPLKQYKKKIQTIYSLKGKEWHFKAENDSKSAISAMEVMDDGNVLVLERSFSGLLNPFIITLKKVYLNDCKKGLCKSEVLLKMNSHHGWTVDNFEGLCKVSKNRYIMISDDNDNFYQKTIMIYFEVVE
jgi:hypothetical protein